MEVLSCGEGGDARGEHCLIDRARIWRECQRDEGTGRCAWLAGQGAEVAAVAEWAVRILGALADADRCRNRTAPGDGRWGAGVGESIFDDSGDDEFSRGIVARAETRR